MVDVSKKGETLREAVVRGSIFMNPKTFKSILSGKIAKGDVLAVAKVAGIMAAKKTSEIIPMCHPLNLSHVEINFYPFEKESRIDIEAKVKIKAQTGVEMEGFVAVATAGLTIYDMCKAIDRGIVLSNIHLVKKTGGKSGTYSAREFGVMSSELNFLWFHPMRSALCPMLLRRNRCNEEKFWQSISVKIRGRRRRIFNRALS